MWKVFFLWQTKVYHSPRCTSLFLLLPFWPAVPVPVLVCIYVLNILSASVLHVCSHIYLGRPSSGWGGKGSFLAPVLGLLCLGIIAVFISNIFNSFFNWLVHAEVVAFILQIQIRTWTVPDATIRHLRWYIYLIWQLTEIFTSVAGHKWKNYKRSL